MSHVRSTSPVAVVTGGGQGLGAATVARFVEAGWRAVILDLDINPALEMQREFGDESIPLVIECNVSVTGDVDRAFQQIGESLSVVDALVNNAGNVSPAPSHAIEDEAWHRLLDTHLGGSMRASRAALRLLLKSEHPSIINLSSVCAERGFPGRLSYNAAKAAVDSLTRTLSTEWGHWGVRVNSVAPGFILTANSATLYESGLADATARASLTSLRRLGQPSEIAEAIFWLASPLSSYVTGQVLVVDGGFLSDGRTGPDNTDVGLEPPWSELRGG